MTLYTGISLKSHKTCFFSLSKQLLLYFIARILIISVNLIYALTNHIFAYKKFNLKKWNLKIWKFKH